MIRQGPEREDLRGLPPELRGAVGPVLSDLRAVPGVEAVVLSGSHARGDARPDSDVDLGLFYSEERPLAVGAIRHLAARHHDGGAPVVSELGEWGPHVDGGAWLTVGGRRVDLLYRSFEHVERGLADAEAGRHGVHHGQQPPHGVFSGTLLGEVAASRTLFDRTGRLAPLQERAARYPEALRRAVVADHLWAVEFGLQAFARKRAALGDVYGVAGCLTRFSHDLVLVLFALNRTHLVDDKTVLARIDGFERAPQAFGRRVAALLAGPGRTASELSAAVAVVEDLFRETAALAGALYRPRYPVEPTAGRGPEPPA